MKFNELKLEIFNKILNTNVSKEDLLFTLYYFNTEEYKNSNLLIQCIENLKIEFLGQCIEFTPDLKNINSDNYYLNTFKQSPVFDLISKLQSHKYNDYILLYREFIQNKINYDFVNPRLYINELPNVFKSAKIFNNFVNSRVNLLRN